MILYEINSLSRSGHHSMMNWLICNLTGCQIEWIWKLTDVAGTGLFHLNDAGKDKDISFDLINKHKNQIKELIVSYEDHFSEYTIFNNHSKFDGRLSLKLLNTSLFSNKRIIFIRDFYNLLASRYQQNQKQLLVDINGNPWNLPIKTHFINLWKSHARACIENQVSYLKFEDWINSSNKRNKFLLNVVGYGEIFGNTKNMKGTTSSFEKQGSVTNRISEVDIPSEIKDLVNQDSELHYLISALGYEYKKL